MPALHSSSPDFNPFQSSRRLPLRLLGTGAQLLATLVTLLVTLAAADAATFDSQSNIYLVSAPMRPGSRTTPNAFQPNFISSVCGYTPFGTRSDVRPGGK